MDTNGIPMVYQTDTFCIQDGYILYTGSGFPLSKVVINRFYYKDFIKICQIKSEVFQ